jgi:hypothetical protein
MLKVAVCVVLYIWTAAGCDREKYTSELPACRLLKQSCSASLKAAGSEAGRLSALCNGAPCLDILQCLGDMLDKTG